MKDVFGQSLYNYWKGGRRTPQVIRRDDGLVTEFSQKFYFAKKFYPTEKAVMPLINGKILDVGCGAGRHVLHFQKRGFDINGIDISPLAIQACKERGCEKVKVMDIFQPQLPANSFDTILLFGHNIGIGATLKGVKKLLSFLKKLIKPHGVLLLTSQDVTKTKEEVHLLYHQRNRLADRYIGEITLRVEYKGQEASDWFTWVHVEPKVLKKLAEETNWTVKEIHEDSDGEYAAALSPVL